MVWKFCEKTQFPNYLPELMRKLCLSSKFSIEELGETTVFYATTV